MNNPPLDGQRTALYDQLVLTLTPYKLAVEKYPRDDPVPPVAVIINPRITFYSGSAVGNVEWSVRLYEVRKASGAAAADFDVVLTDLLRVMGKGMGMGYVLERVENAIMNDMGYQLPGYIVIGTVPLANC